MSRKGPKRRIVERIYPEVRRFPKYADAERIVENPERPRRYWVEYAAALGGAACLTIPIGGFLPGSLSGVSTAMLVWCGLCVVGWRWRWFTRQKLRKELAARGIPICIRCGYDIRGLTDARCPECGTEFDPSLLGGPEECSPDNPSDAPRPGQP